LRPWLWAGLAYGASVYLWLVVEGLLGDVTMVVDFARVSHPLRSGLHALLADYRHLAGADVLVHVAGIAFVALLARGAGRPGAVTEAFSCPSVFVSRAPGGAP
jgi:hypothetical protein